jgi:hypothetical protein
LRRRLGGRRFRRRAGADVRFGRSELNAIVSAVLAVPGSGFGP